jgi:hypothetical protein
LEALFALRQLSGFRTGLLDGSGWKQKHEQWVVMTARLTMTASI